MADLAQAWLAGSQQSIDFAFKRHAAELQAREDARQQRKDDFAFSQAQQAIAERDRINAAAAQQLGAFQGMQRQAPRGASPVAQQASHPMPQIRQDAAPAATTAGITPAPRQGMSPWPELEKPDLSLPPQQFSDNYPVQQQPDYTGTNMSIAAPHGSFPGDVPFAPVTGQQGEFSGVTIPSGQSMVEDQPIPSATATGVVPAGGGTTTPVAGGVAGGAVQAGVGGTNLAIGARGEDVAELQQFLQQNGLMTAEQIATGPGVFGPQTQSALKEWQARNGVPATGFFGPLTRAAIQAQAQQQAAPSAMSNVAEGRVTMVPAEAVSPAETSDIDPVPDSVPAPDGMTRASVDAAAQTYQRQLATIAQQDANEKEWRLNTYAQQIRQLASLHPSIGYAVQYGGVTIDIPSYNEAYNDYSTMYQRMMVQNGDINAVEAMAAANGWTVSGFDMNGNIKFTAQDPEQQIDHQFGMTRGEAEMLAAVMDVAEINGGFLPADYVEQNMQTLLHFPKLFKWRRDSNGQLTTDMQVEDQGFPVSQDFFAMVEGRRNAVSSASGMTRASQLLLAREKEARMAQQQADKFRTNFRAELAKWRDQTDGIPERVTQRMAREWNARNPDDQITPLEVAQTADLLVFDDEEKAAITRLRDEYLNKWRVDAAATAADLRRELAQFAVTNRRPLRGRSGGSGRSVVGMGAVQAVDIAANGAYNAIMQARKPRRNGGGYTYDGLANNPAYASLANDPAGRDAIIRYVESANRGVTAAVRSRQAPVVLDVMERNGLAGEDGSYTLGNLGSPNIAAQVSSQNSRQTSGSVVQSNTGGGARRLRYNPATGNLE